MGILLAFAPFFAFVVVERLVGVTAGLVAATLISGGLLVRGALGRNKAMKVLEVGTVVLFGGLTTFTLMVGAAWSIPAVRLCVDAGLLLLHRDALIRGQEPADQTYTRSARRIER